MNWFPWRSQKTTGSGLTRVRHITFAQTRMGRSISHTGLFLKKHLWVYPLAAIVVLSALGYFLRGAIESTMQDSVRSQLQTLLSVEASMLTSWLKSQEENADSHANDQHVRELVYQLLEEGEAADAPPGLAAKSSVLAKLKKELTPRLQSNDYHSYMILDKTGRVIAAEEDSLVGKMEFAEFLEQALQRVADGETVIVPPYPSRILMKDDAGLTRSGVPVMMVLAPIRSPSFQSVATLAFRIRPEREFTKLLQLGRIGESGETYAFDHEGRMVSNSRFDANLILLGLLVDESGSRSLLQIQLRDPGGSMVEGYRPNKRRSELPLTKAAAEAITGRDGTDVIGYRDYRGVPVLGAWTWLPKYNLGVVTEIDHAEAYRPLHILQWAFWGLYSMLAMAAVAIFVFSIVVARLQRAAQQAALETQKLGQYTLEEKLGSGGMGMVYKGRHAVLRRPTAIKMLQLDRISEDSVARFEREVKITSQLNHPNTVQIYDYGRTPEGLFYYAMEYLDGIDLQKLVDAYGPQTEGRVIHILTQVCGSLYEAHSMGLVHRDIKPANVMLNRRGGEPDVAKVLDFGLVKALDESKQNSLTAAGSLTGTPLYMSPEAIQTPNAVDARSDLYAVGALGYFLLTGQALFDVQNIVELCRMHVSQTPVAPSERLGRPISVELEAAILACLEKSLAKRPQTARDLAALLARAPTANAWSINEADLWWSRHERGMGTSSLANAPGQAKSDADLSLEKTYEFNG